MERTELNLSNPAIAGHMVTVSGTVVDLFNFDASLVTLEDIAHGLAYNCRWNGHTQSYYSVAEHCIRMHDKHMCDKEFRDYLLFHDCEESLWGDMIRPLKMILKTKCPEVLEKMRETRAKIMVQYGVNPNFNHADADAEELEWEFKNLILSKNHLPMPPFKAKQEWLIRAHRNRYPETIGA